ncbi:MAG TPA: branched-chain alpha-keto acid dehydrogenase subunit E2 [Gammaproteobacteria bacterium]|nr:branched-chain alpha-keto acid dehydrogenase subunit E2 [Gammaproteobacteria bacterium]
MAYYSFTLPDVGEGIVEVEVSDWMVAVGDVISQDQPIAEVMTDKATVEITSPVAGNVVSIAGEAGTMLAVGAELVGIETAGDDSPTASPATAEPEPPRPAEATPPPAAGVDHSSDADSGVPVAEPQTPPDTTETTPPSVFSHERPAAGKVLASPAVRRRAREAEIDLHKVATSDSSGRVGHQDLNAHIASLGELAIGGVRKVRTGTTQIPLKGLRRIIAKQMETSKRNIPHYSYVEEIDLTDLERLRNHLNANRSDTQSHLTLLPFFMLAMVRTTRLFPQCNAHYDEDSSTLKQYNAVHLGMATMTDDGLKVPVLRHVEAMDVWQCAAEIKRLADAARDNSIALAELSGSTMTLTSLGSLGGIASTPIINHPEVSIIGINRAEERVMVRDGQTVIRYMMNLSASFDHRIVDGHTGASMVQHMKSLIEYPATLFI